MQIDPGEIEHLRIASRHTIEIEQFVDLDDLDPAFFEKPYFLLPDKETQAEAFAVVRKALMDTAKAGLGKFAMGGREHLLAIRAPSDAKLAGMMAYTLRYAAELRRAADYFSEIKAPRIDSEQLSLAKELIERRVGKFNSDKFTDDYEVALRELVEAKLKHLPLPLEEKTAPRGKVINLMDALRRSVNTSEEDKSATRAAKGKTRERLTKHGFTVHERTKGEKRRKSA